MNNTLSISSLLINISKTLNIANEIIPIINDYKPLIDNFKNIYNNITKNDSDDSISYPKSSKKEINNQMPKKEIKRTINHSPQFFI